MIAKYLMLSLLGAILFAIDDERESRHSLLLREICSLLASVEVDQYPTNLLYVFAASAAAECELQTAKRIEGHWPDYGFAFAFGFFANEQKMDSLLGNSTEPGKYLSFYSLGWEHGGNSTDELINYLSSKGDPGQQQIESLFFDSVLNDQRESLGLFEALLPGEQRIELTRIAASRIGRLRITKQFEEVFGAHWLGSIPDQYLSTQELEKLFSAMLKEFKNREFENALETLNAIDAQLKADGKENLSGTALRTRVLIEICGYAELKPSVLNALNRGDLHYYSILLENDLEPAMQMLNEVEFQAFSKLLPRAAIFLGEVSEKEVVELGEKLNPMRRLFLFSMVLFEKSGDDNDERN